MLAPPLEGDSPLIVDPNAVLARAVPFFNEWRRLPGSAARSLIEVAASNRSIFILAARSKLAKAPTASRKRRLSERLPDPDRSDKGIERQNQIIFALVLRKLTGCVRHSALSFVSSRSPFRWSRRRGTGANARIVSVVGYALPTRLDRMLALEHTDPRPAAPQVAFWFQGGQSASQYHIHVPGRCCPLSARDPRLFRQPSSGTPISS